MGMCAITCCTPVFCAGGIATATAPLCCCREKYLDSKVQKASVVGGMVVSAVALALYIWIRTVCSRDCTTTCPSDDLLRPPSVNGTGGCATQCDTSFTLWSGSGACWSEGSAEMLAEGTLCAVLLGFGIPHLVAGLTCARWCAKDDDSAHPQPSENAPLVVAGTVVAAAAPPVMDRGGGKPEV